VTTDVGPLPAPKREPLKPTDELGGVISRKTLFDVPPPGLGLTTVTEAVPMLAMSEARMLAVSRELLTKVVVRGLPFHFTTEPETNPVPFTVSVNPAEPGLTASGTSGWLIRGTGFAVPVVARLFTSSTSTCGAWAARRTGVASAAKEMITTAVLVYAARRCILEIQFRNVFVMLIPLHEKMSEKTHFQQFAEKCA
jgi:hypothetical protein